MLPCPTFRPLCHTDISCKVFAVSQVLIAAGTLSVQLAALESSLHTAVLNLTELIDQATGPEPTQALTMVALRLQQPEARAFCLCFSGLAIRRSSHLAEMHSTKIESCLLFSLQVEAWLVMRHVIVIVGAGWRNCGLVLTHMAACIKAKPLLPLMSGCPGAFCHHLPNSE